MLRRSQVVAAVEVAVVVDAGEEGGPLVGKDGVGAVRYPNPAEGVQVCNNVVERVVERLRPEKNSRV